MGGLFPTAYGIGGADSMLVPMTLAMAWGLTTGTILTLIWIPAGYAILEDFFSLLRKIPFLKERIRESEFVDKVEELSL
jgi:Cu/Ag efflux pump CusA